MNVRILSRFARCNMNRLGASCCFGLEGSWVAAGAQVVDEHGLGDRQGGGSAASRWSENAWEALAHDSGGYHGYLWLCPRWPMQGVTGYKAWSHPSYLGYRPASALCLGNLGSPLVGQPGQSAVGQPGQFNIHACYDAP